MKVQHVVLAALLFAVATAAAQQDSSLPQRFTAAAVNIGGPRSQAGASQVEIAINRWSTPEQTERLISTLKEKGSDALLGVLQDMEPVGTINTPGELGYQLRYATQVPTADGGRRIFLATDRPIGAWEARTQPLSFEYPFTYIELRMNGEGDGEGKLALATKIDISASGRVIELVNYASQPVQLNNVRLRDRTVGTSG